MEHLVEHLVKYVVERLYSASRQSYSRELWISNLFWEKFISAMQIQSSRESLGMAAAIGSAERQPVLSGQIVDRKCQALAKTRESLADRIA